MVNNFPIEKTTKINPTRQMVFSDTCYNVYTSDQVFFSSGDYPHTHPYHEIFILLEGELDYLVEGTIFPITSGDIIFIRSGDPHSKYKKTSDAIKILVLEIAHEFFSENNCMAYEQVFSAKYSTEHKISASVAKSSGLTDVYRKLLHYGNGNSAYAKPVIRALLIEFLYLLGSAEFSKNYIANQQIQQIVDYINNHYTQKISLNEIAEELFISKTYLCRLFKQHTGNTVKSYITGKRLAHVERLTVNGFPISKACLHAGFPDYSTFYKSFLKAYGKSPKSKLH